MKRVLIDGSSLTLEELVSVARRDFKIAVAPSALRNVKRARSFVKKLVSQRKIVYGVDTGVGPMCNTIIAPEKMLELQRNLVLSHSSGAGFFLPRDAVRATMLLRANVLARGNSGVKPDTIKTVVRMLNRGVHPRIPEIGSVGASGDLIPLAHVALAMMGEGECEFNGRVKSSSSALNQAGLKPWTPSYKEGLAMMNGTSATTAVAALAVHDAENLVKSCEIAAALSMEALTGITDALDAELHRLKPHPGQMKSAANMRGILRGSRLVKTREKIVAESAVEQRRIQDSYSLRCSPQATGACRDGLRFVRKIVETEMNSATDNPLISKDGKVLHGGNFLGQHIALAMDVLAIAATELGVISERRLARLLDRSLSEGLPQFLVHRQPGVNSGLMGVQYVATSLVSECKNLSTPVSIDSIPTNANNQDLVSMGWYAARRARSVIDNVARILSVELLSAAQGVEFRDPSKMGRGTQVAHREIRKLVPPLLRDRPLSADVKRVTELVSGGRLVQAVERVVGHLS